MPVPHPGVGEVVEILLAVFQLTRNAGVVVLAGVEQAGNRSGGDCRTSSAPAFERINNAAVFVCASMDIGYRFVDDFFGNGNAGVSTSAQALNLSNGR